MLGRGKGRSDRALWVIGAIAVLAVLAPVAYWIFATGRPVPTYGPSMRPTLMRTDPVEIDYDAYDRAEPRIGDVIVLQGPAEQSFLCVPPAAPRSPCASPPQDHGDYLIKRVVAEPGDEIAIAGDGTVIRNGRRQSEPYILPCANRFACALPNPITVPAGHYFVMGDNRGNSTDSRVFGPVPRSAIDGRILLPGGSG